MEIPVAVLGNKTDKPGCYGRVELLNALGIQGDAQTVRYFPLLFHSVALH